ncbi:uncharacterized protein ACA1_055840 [Acanthamoeba castellanii str. Neff]|uniref:Uncharacterized protein n=1 Tax=Acanthamoeba castellanii (strain ATCC 30010 / Neff) TaxID=1257118 RepID=L8H7U9_ACACF|nr:uncharacterized protein ACA1_055840 [Acanthamoeba castellanii str. Neff]ELR20808.1 hypothetical protein ACA1_055840 [Acanthamoeba castellanii str. Neff]
MFNRRHEDDPPSGLHHPHHNGAAASPVVGPKAQSPQMTITSSDLLPSAAAPHFPAHQPTTAAAHHHSPALSPRSVRQRAEDLVTSLTPPASPLAAPRESGSPLAGPEKRKEEALFLPKQGDNDEEALLPLAMGQALVWKTWEEKGETIRQDAELAKKLRLDAEERSGVQPQRLDEDAPVLSDSQFARSLDLEEKLEAQRSAVSAHNQRVMAHQAPPLSDSQFALDMDEQIAAMLQAADLSRT